MYLLVNLNSDGMECCHAVYSRLSNLGFQVAAVLAVVVCRKPVSKPLTMPDQLFILELFPSACYTQ
jgi:hypothetical protein